VRGVGEAICDTCGVRYLRNQLTRCSDGMLRCVGPGTNNDGRGRNARELSELEAMEAANFAHHEPLGDTGTVEHDDYTEQDT
jgi:hypothetical protein